MHFPLPWRYTVITLLPSQTLACWWDTSFREVSEWGVVSAFWGSLWFLWKWHGALDPMHWQLPLGSIKDDISTKHRHGPHGTRGWQFDSYNRANLTVSELLPLNFYLCQGLRTHLEGLQLWSSDTGMLVPVFWQRTEWGQPLGAVLLRNLVSFPKASVHGTYQFDFQHIRLIQSRCLPSYSAF